MVCEPVTERLTLENSLPKKVVLPPNQNKKLKKSWKKFYDFLSYFFNLVSEIFGREKNVNFCSSNLFHDNFILATRFQCFTDCPMVCNPIRKLLGLVQWISTFWWSYTPKSKSLTFVYPLLTAHIPQGVWYPRLRTPGLVVKAEYLQPISSGFHSCHCLIDH